MGNIIKELKSKDVAYILDCSPDDCIMWAKKGLLRAEKRGRYWIYLKTDVQEFKVKLKYQRKKEALRAAHAAKLQRYH